MNTTYSLFAGDALLGVINEELEVLSATTGTEKDRNALQYLVDQVRRGKGTARLMVHPEDSSSPIPLKKLMRKAA